MLFLAEHNLSFHGLGSKIRDPESGLFLNALGLHIRVLVLHLQKSTPKNSISEHLFYWGVMPPDPLSTSMLRMLIVVLHTINPTSNFTIYKGPHLYFMLQVP